MSRETPLSVKRFLTLLGRRDREKIHTRTSSRVDSRHYLRGIGYDLGPVSTGKHEDRQPPSSHLLLMSHSLISGHEDFKSCASSAKASSVPRFFFYDPAQSIGAAHHMTQRYALEPAVSALLDQREFSVFRAVCGSNLKRGGQLLTGDSVVPIEELIDGAAMIQMVEKCPRWNSRSPKNRDATHYVRVLREHID